MSDPGYDFFATGRPQAPPGGPAVPEPPLAPPPPAAPQLAAPQYAAPAPARTFQMPNGTQVNQFGTPVGEAAAPTGPYAAPGVAAVPTAAPGMVSTWGGPPAPAGHRAAPQPAATGEVPRNVRAVAALAVVVGLLLLFSTWQVFSAYQQVSGVLDEPGMSADQKAFLAPLLTLVVVVLLVMAVVTVLCLVGGVATVAGQRWGGWMLVAAYGLFLLGQLYQFGHGMVGFSSFLWLAIGLVLLLVLVTGEGLAWLLGRR
jgi:hypothetical protein